MHPGKGEDSGGPGGESVASDISRTWRAYDQNAKKEIPQDRLPLVDKEASYRYKLPT